VFYTDIDFIRCQTPTPDDERLAAIEPLFERVRMDLSNRERFHRATAVLSELSRTRSTFRGLQPHVAWDIWTWRAGVMRRRDINTSQTPDRGS
jgi:hypothetical protein